MNLVKLFSKNHEYQMPGLCGPAVARIALKTALEYQGSGQNTVPTQKEIARSVFSGPVLSHDDIMRMKMQ